MSKISLNHFSFNTGHCALHTDNYFHQHTSLKSRFLELAQKSLQPGGAKVIGNITFEAMESDDCYAGTLFSNIGGKKVPLLTTFGARTNTAGKAFWEMFQEITSMAPGIARTKQHSPRAPFIAECIYHDCLPDIHAYNFFFSGKSSDFCKCIGWAFLFPDTFGGCHNTAEKGSEKTGAECPDIADMIEWLAAMTGAPAIHELQERFAAMSRTYYEEYEIRSKLIRNISDQIGFVKWAAPLLDSNLDITKLDGYLSTMNECPDGKEALKWLVTAKGNHDKDGMATRTEMMREAIQRMEMLGLAQESISNFQKNGKLDSVMEHGRFHPLDEADRKRIQKYESIYGCLAYAAVRGKFEYGRTINYIIVSPHKEDWTMDRMMICQDTVLTYSYNYDTPVSSESGPMGIGRLPSGTLKRTW